MLGHTTLTSEPIAVHEELGQIDEVADLLG